MAGGEENTTRNFGSANVHTSCTAFRRGECLNGGALRVVSRALEPDHPVSSQRTNRHFLPVFNIRMPKANHGSRGVVCCPICQGHFLPRGFPRHSKKCERDKRMREEAHASASHSVPSKCSKSLTSPAF